MRLRNKILLTLFGTAVFLLLGIYLAIFKFGLLEYIVNRKLKAMIDQNLPIKVQIGKISGDYFSRLVLSDLNVTYDDGKYSYEMAVIPRVTAEYSLSNLWHGILVFQRIDIDSAHIILHESTEQKWLVPKPLLESKQEAGPIDFEIKELKLNNLDL
ncbi:MAG: hypothetical protein NTV06_03085, partial [candidate division Zixibacteria bacterium]|nr:hypothetical protein [candidate division Zixibacteria bacterium]